MIGMMMRRMKGMIIFMTMKMRKMVMLKMMMMIRRKVMIEMMIVLTAIMILIMIGKVVLFVFPLWVLGCQCLTAGFNLKYS